MLQLNLGPRRALGPRFAAERAEATEGTVMDVARLVKRTRWELCLPIAGVRVMQRQCRPGSAEMHDVSGEDERHRGCSGGDWRIRGLLRGSWRGSPLEAPCWRRVWMFPAAAVRGADGLVRLRDRVGAAGLPPGAQSNGPAIDVRIVAGMRSSTR